MWQRPHNQSFIQKQQKTIQIKLNKKKIFHSFKLHKMLLTKDLNQNNIFFSVTWASAFRFWHDFTRTSLPLHLTLSLQVSRRGWLFRTSLPVIAFLQNVLFFLIKKKLCLIIQCSPNIARERKSEFRAVTVLFLRWERKGYIFISPCQLEAAVLERELAVWLFLSWWSKRFRCSLFFKCECVCDGRGRRSLGRDEVCANHL